MVFFVETPIRLYVCGNCYDASNIVTRNACMPADTQFCGECGCPIQQNPKRSVYEPGHWTVEEELTKAPVIYHNDGTMKLLQYREITMPADPTGLTVQQWRWMLGASQFHLRSVLRDMDDATAQHVLAMLHSLNCHLAIPLGTRF